MNPIPHVALTFEAAEALKMLPGSINKKGWVSELILDALPRQFPGIQLERPRADMNLLITLASPLSGMTREVIASHFARFPFLTVDTYRLVIQELLRRQASPEGLKNPEAAAYGLCKQIQAGKAILPATSSKPAANDGNEEQGSEDIPNDVLTPYAN